jgi:hypothetical protein
MSSLPEYRIIEGSLQDRFMKLRTKIQFYGGGFGNGKTSGTCVKAIQLMRDYPGSHGAVLRETLPKVTTTTMKEKRSRQNRVMNTHFSCRYKKDASLSRLSRIW